MKDTITGAIRDVDMKRKHRRCHIETHVVCDYKENNSPH